MEEMFEFLSQFYPLSSDCVEYLREAVRFRKVFRNDIILDINEINRNLYFIKKGALQCIYLVGEEEVADWFFFENETVVSVGSFYDQVPSEDRIVAIEDSELYYITWDQYDHARRTYIEFANIALVLLEKYLKVFHGHIRLIRKHQAPERYQLLLEKQPELVRRIPVGPLATWLDMAPETLSRVRSRRD